MRNLGYAAAAFLLAACGGNSAGLVGPMTSQSSVVHSQFSPMTAHGTHRIGKDAQTLNVLYPFAGIPDASNPDDTLLDVGGTFYGTTYLGGVSNEGTVYSITPSGAYTELYSFAGGSDGANPYGPLVNVNGTLYGVAYFGGANNDGVIYSITPASTISREHVIHTFSGSDGANPYAGLISEGNTLYGSTQAGGANGAGCIFEMTTSGTETVLHSFAGSDGAAPSASLLKVGSKFYGVTNAGGTNGQGTVFAMTTSGHVTVLHSFSGSDGASPNDGGGLIKVGSALYGTTLSGGSGYGTIFKITTGGSFTSLYSFKGMGGNDGANPYAGLTSVNGTLFGVTSDGGNVGCNGGCGTIFALLPNGGPEIVVYSFTGTNDGYGPYGGLLDVGGTLYGTAQYAGLNNHGTVFSLSF